MTNELTQAIEKGEIPRPPEPVKTKKELKETQKKEREELKKKEKENAERVRTEQQRRKVILKKYKGILKSYYDTTEFKEPIGILLRRTGRAEFHEDLSTSRTRSIIRRRR